MKKILLLGIITAILGASDISEILQKGASIQNNTDYRSLLSSAVNKAVIELGKGFIKNQTAKIDLPPSLKTAAILAKKVGGEKWAKELQNSINDAATKAVGGAGEVFLDDIKSMSNDDIKSLLTSGDNALSKYLQNKSGDKLKAVFKPIVSEMMSQNSFATAYNGLNSFVSNKISSNQAVQNLAKNLGASEYIPSQGEDLNDYITQKTIDGLFAVMKEKESALRSGFNTKGGEILKTILK
ncbi:MAG: DUF4197 domain-containing protein [Campylobacter sp.]|nr:DUF4197 domain-containing protein [Campylobacter sp.]